MEKSFPSSRWQNVEVLCGCTNSIGSSSVTMWPGSFSLNSLRRAARVVVLPDPVAPVTRMSPVFSLVIFPKTAGRPSASTVGIFVARIRMTIP